MGIICRHIFAPLQRAITNSDAVGFIKIKSRGFTFHKSGYTGRPAVVHTARYGCSFINRDTYLVKHNVFNFICRFAANIQPIFAGAFYVAEVNIFYHTYPAFCGTFVIAIRPPVSFCPGGDAWRNIVASPSCTAYLWATLIAEHR